MNGASSGLPSWVKTTSSTPQPHHFIAVGVAPPWDIRALDHSAAHHRGPAARTSAGSAPRLRDAARVRTVRACCATSTYACSPPRC
jgi:hypothetical protein